jgi:hypothetical protein
MDAIVKYPNRWPAGVSGNPDGRPVGSRTAFSAAFMRDLAVSWNKDGAKVLERVAKDNPSGYFSVCARLLPADVAVTIQAQSPALDARDLSILRAIRDAIPDANAQTPEAVLQFTLDAIRAANAKPVESSPRAEFPITENNS